MKDGRTRLSYKAENAVDLKTSIIVSARVEHGDRGDTATLLPTIETAEKNLRRVNKKSQILDVVADKGYHMAETQRRFAPTPQRGGAITRTGVAGSLGMTWRFRRNTPFSPEKGKRSWNNRQQGFKR